MIRTSALIIVMTISVFMLYGGCNGDNVLTTDEAPPGEEAPAGQSPECQNCPCKYFDVPMTEDCWVALPDEAPEFMAIELTRAETFSCGLFANDGRTGNSFETPTSDCTDLCIQSRCFVGTNLTDRCSPPSVAFNLNTTEEVDACRSCLEQYATELNESGISVIGGPPYICAPPSP